MKISQFFFLAVFGHKTINNWTKFHGKKIFKFIIRYGKFPNQPYYAGLNFLVRNFLRNIFLSFSAITRSRNRDTTQLLHYGSQIGNPN